MCAIASVAGFKAKSVKFFIVISVGLVSINSITAFSAITVFVQIVYLTL